MNESHLTPHIEPEDRMDYVPDTITKALRQIINTGSCAITPPIVGYLVQNGIMAEGGFNIEKAKLALDQLTK